MIQRIQSIYLLLTTILSVLFLSGNIISFTDPSGTIIVMTLKGVMRMTEASDADNPGNLLPVIIMTMSIALISFLTIFLYGKRSLQIRLTIGLLILTIVMIFILAGYVVYIMSKFDAELVAGIKIIIPLLMAVCIYLAYRGIKKDDDLVRSFDRLR